MKIKTTITNRVTGGKIMTGTALIGLALNALAGSDQTATAPTPAQSAKASSILQPNFQKPVWLTDLSLGLKQYYDDNVLLVSGNGPLHPQSSWVTTVSPKIGFNIAPLLGDQSLFQTLSFCYAPDFTTYYEAPDESNIAHRFLDTISGKANAFSFGLDNSVYYIDGSDLGPTYPGNDKYRSGFASVIPKERREQVQDRAKAVFQYDWNTFFIRPTATLLDYEMMTKFLPTTGYQNYPSRRDVNGGADLGYRVTKDVAVTVGYRYGHQYQQMLPLSIDSNQFSSSSDYQRVLLGIEGKPWSWLNVAMQGGPDFRSYAATAAVTERHQVTYYGEALIAATFSPDDTLTFKYKQWRWVAYCGRVPYFDSNFDLDYNHKLTKQLSFDLEGRIASYDFTCGSDPKGNNLRNDYLYSIAPGLSYAFTRNFSLSATGLVEFARNAQDNPPGGAEYRQFDHTLVSMTATYKF